ncbi:DUF4352 domain-containing protein [Neobacillus sp. LXY-4]|uniref:DUF4352 domain-containing protein n=1 Tax=Neobacillus sp. LXY-4 TaxID=3379826 RepID=UPI003EE193E9
MLKRFIIVSIGLLIPILLVSCFVDVESTNQKVEEIGQEKREFTSLDELGNFDWKNQNHFDWDKLYFSKQDFKEILLRITDENENGKSLYSDAELVDNKTVVLTVNNSDGASFENLIQAAVMDTFIRQFYAHTELFDDQKDPVIRSQDLAGTVIAENNGPIDFDEDTGRPKILGTFKLGDKVDVEGNIITFTNAQYTDQRVEFEENQPVKVLLLDLEFQNDGQAEAFITDSDFEVYDYKGDKMDTYPVAYFNGKIQPGKLLKGQQTYGVSGKGPYKIYYKNNITGAKAAWVIDVK